MPDLNNRWLPIGLFRPETFPGGQPFLVWLIDADGQEWWEAAQYGPDDFAPTGEPIGSMHITGEWRHVEELRHLEPVAYQAGPRGPHEEEGRT
jgi:hypothetical protein